MEAFIQFVLEIDKLKTVTRKIRPTGQNRYENSAEHSWQIALFASSLAHYASAPIDVNKVVMMLLVHDVGEIDTGDTMVFVETGWAGRKEAEWDAVQRIFGILPAPHHEKFLSLWKEFEHGDSPEAVFARSVDRAMPALLNLAQEGISWRENEITFDRVIARIGPEIAAGCPALWEYMERELLAAREKGWFGGN